MAAPARTPDEDEPLDPAIERVRVKLARLVLIAMGTLVLGVVAVLAAVIYRASGDGSSALPGGTATIQLVPGARLVASSVSGDRILLQLALPDGSSEVVLVDAATGRPGLRLVLREGDVPPAETTRAE